MWEWSYTTVWIPWYNLIKINRISRNFSQIHKELEQMVRKNFLRASNEWQDELR